MHSLMVALDLNERDAQPSIIEFCLLTLCKINIVFSFCFFVAERQKQAENRR